MESSLASPFRLEDVDVAIEEMEVVFMEVSTESVAVDASSVWLATVSEPEFSARDTRLLRHIPDTTWRLHSMPPCAASNLFESRARVGLPLVYRVINLSNFPMGLFSTL